MFYTIWKILYYSGVIVPFIGTITGAVFYKRLKTEHIIIWIFILGSFFMQLLTIYFGILQHKGYSLFLIPAYGFFEFIVFSILYAKFFSTKNRIPFWIIVAIVSVLLITEGVYSYLNQDPASFISYGKIIGNITIITYCGYYMMKSVLDRRKKINPVRINLSFILFIYYTITLLLYVAINFLVNNSLQIVAYFWFFHAFIMILFYGTLTVFLWKHGKNRKSLQ